VAIAASVTVVASTAIVADGAPRVFAEPAAPKVEKTTVSFTPVPEPSKAAVLVKSKAKARGKGHDKVKAKGKSTARGHEKAKLSEAKAQKAHGQGRNAPKSRKKP
jgi:hypothetical protein